MNHPQTRFSKLGLGLFGIYLLLYSGFVFLNAFAPQAMESTPIAGLNVAILYGFVLIIAAVILSMIYGLFCQDEPEASSDTSKKNGDAA